MSALNSLWCGPVYRGPPPRVDLNCMTEPSSRTMVRSMLTTPLNGAFGMGVIKKLWAEARGEGIATAYRTVQETEVRDSRVGIRNLRRNL